MDGQTYSYLETAARSAVGETLLDPRPAFVFAADGTRLLYANAAGATLLGAADIGEALKIRFSDLNPLKAQMARLSRLLPSETARVEMLRLGQGVTMTTLPAACRRLNLAGDERAVLAVVAVGAGAGAESLAARAERLVDTIGGDGTLAAVVNADGKVLAASDGYDAVAPAESTIDAMIGAARGTDDAVVQRSVAIGGSTRAAGAVRFRADGRDLFLLVLGPAEAGAAAVMPREPEPRLEPVATPAEADQSLDQIEVAAETVAPESDDAGADTAPAEVSAPLPSRVVRFVFETDAEGRFTLASAELAATVGEAYGAVVGRRWADVAGVLSFDVAGAFAGGVFSLAVAWPAGGGEAVAVALTGAPVHGRDRRITGYRGFGTIRPDERTADARADAAGLDTIVEAPSPAGTKRAEPEAAAPEPPRAAETRSPVAIDEATPDAHLDLDEAAQHSIERGTRGTRRAAPPVERRAPAPRPEPPALTGETVASNIVRLPGAPGRTAPERLTGSERDAFRRIAEALGTRRAEANAPPVEAEAAPARKEIGKAPATDIDTRLLDRLPIGIVVFRDHKTLFANRTLLDLLGYDGYDAFLDGGGAEAIFPGDEGLAGNIAEAGGRLSATRRDGGSVPVKAWLHAVPWGGATALMLSLSAGRARDEASEDELTLDMARTEARADELEAILDTATDGVIVIDGRGRIGSLNRAAEALFGISGKDYVGRYFTDLIADESQKAALDYLDGLAANGVASVLNDGREVIGRVPAGGLIPLFMTMGRIGSSDKFCAVLRDITHWKNVEEELIAARRAAEAANAQKSDFLAKISHEIRTPLNAIIGFSEVMMGERFGPVGNERYRDYLRDINVSGAHLLSLINDLLDLSKIEAGKLELSFEAVPVNAAIQECVALMQPQANRERIIIRTSLSAEVPNVVADQRSFRQILLNLMSNAVKFTRAGGQVIVSTSLEATGEVVVRIRDTGIGMSEKDIETALKPFRQVAAARDDRDHGTGLGLPLTKALVEANRATFAIDSTPNQGTLVKITFPTTRVLAG